MRLFCYGTLMVPAVWLKVIGREAEGADAVLRGFVCRRVRDRCYPGLLPKPDGQTQGVLYTGLSPRDFRLLDHYEGPEYRRLLLPVILQSGKQERAWCFVTRADCRSRLRRDGWSLQDFVRTHLGAYLREL